MKMVDAVIDVGAGMSLPPASPDRKRGRRGSSDRRRLIRKRTPVPRLGSGDVDVRVDVEQIGEGVHAGAVHAIQGHGAAAVESDDHGIGQAGDAVPAGVEIVHVDDRVAVRVKQIREHQAVAVGAGLEIQDQVVALV